MVKRISKFTKELSAELYNCCNMSSRNPIRPHLKKISELIAKGADVNASVDRHLQKAVPMTINATLTGKASILDLIIKAGADVDKGDAMGFTPLHWSIMRNEEHMTKKLLGHVKNINAQTNSGETPLIRAVREQHYDISLLLLRHKADRTIADHFNKTALDYAREKGHEKLIHLLETDMHVIASEITAVNIQKHVQSGFATSHVIRPVRLIPHKK